MLNACKRRYNLFSLLLYVNHYEALHISVYIQYYFNTVCVLVCAEEKVNKIETLRKANRESERERRGVSE